MPQGPRDNETTIAVEADWKLFDHIADRLKSELGGRWVERLDGIATRWWDLQVGDEIVTLHLEDQVGITLFPAEEQKLGLYRDACALFEGA